MIRCVTCQFWTRIEDKDIGQCELDEMPDSYRIYYSDCDKMYSDDGRQQVLLKTTSGHRIGLVSVDELSTDYLIISGRVFHKDKSLKDKQFPQYIEVSCAVVEET